MQPSHFCLSLQSLSTHHSEIMSSLLTLQPSYFCPVTAVTIHTSLRNHAMRGLYSERAWHDIQVVWIVTVVTGQNWEGCRVGGLNMISGIVVHSLTALKATHIFSVRFITMWLVWLDYERGLWIWGIASQVYVCVLQRVTALLSIARSLFCKKRHMYVVTSVTGWRWGGLL